MYIFLKEFLLKNFQTIKEGKEKNRIRSKDKNVEKTKKKERRKNKNNAQKIK